MTMKTYYGHWLRSKCCPEPELWCAGAPRHGRSLDRALPPGPPFKAALSRPFFFSFFVFISSSILVGSLRKHQSSPLLLKLGHELDATERLRVRGVGCVACTWATTTSTWMCVLGIWGSRSLFQKLLFFLLADLERPGCAPRNWLVRMAPPQVTGLEESAREVSEWQPSHTPSSEATVSCAFKTRPLASDVRQEREPWTPLCTHWLSISPCICRSGQRHSQCNRHQCPRIQTSG